MSRRVEKEVETWTGMEWSNVVTIAFTYDGWNMISEARSDESKPNYYVWGLDLSGTLQGAGGVGGLLARVRQENIPHPLYYAADANGNITEVLNNTGTLAAHYEYDPFGNTIAQSGDLADANPFRFSSKYWDAGVGVYYYGYRFYNPELGRWINRDPIGESGFRKTWDARALLEKATRARVGSLYSFVYGDPILLTDVLGLDAYDDCVQDALDFYKECVITGAIGCGVGTCACLLLAPGLTKAACLIAAIVGCRKVPQICQGYTDAKLNLCETLKNASRGEGALEGSSLVSGSQGAR